jgi:hypothetical protein
MVMPATHQQLSYSWGPGREVARRGEEMMTLALPSIMVVYVPPGLAFHTVYSFFVVLRTNSERFCTGLTDWFQ